MVWRRKIDVYKRQGHPIVSMPADTPAKAAFLKLAETVREATQA